MTVGVLLLAKYFNWSVHVGFELLEMLVGFVYLM